MDKMTDKELEMYDREYAEILKGLAVPIHAEPAMDRAIELLEQEPCEDAISREAVLNIINERKFVHTMEYGEYIGEDSRQDELLYAATVKNIVLALTGVEPTRPHGEWKYVDYGNGCGNWHCTSCRNICVEMRLAKNNYNFCPNCGADMRADILAVGILKG